MGVEPEWGRGRMRRGRPGGDLVGGRGFVRGRGVPGAPGAGLKLFGAGLMLVWAWFLLQGRGLRGTCGVFRGEPCGGVA